MAQIAAAHKWWQANRLASPFLFAQEIAFVVARLRDDERAGTLYPSRSVPGVRRVLCSRTRYHVYYIVDDELNAAVKWQSMNDVSSLAGKCVRMRFVLKDADLFALRFALMSE